MGRHFGIAQIYVAAVLFLGIASPPSSAQAMCATGAVCVTTWHNDNYRTGDNLSEGTLTPTSITSDNFGQLCSAQLDGQVYAQPLVVTGVTLPKFGATFNVVYVVTENDSVYAINATPLAQNNQCQILLGPVSLLNGNFAGQPTMSPVACGNIGGSQCLAISPIVGVLGTPVINVESATAGTLYVVAHMQSVSGGGVFSYYHFLHALDITTLNEGINNEKYHGPVQVCGGVGCGTYSPSQFSQTHVQRPGLLFANCGSSACANANYVYVAFSMMDGQGWPYPNGAIFGYNATNLTSSPLYFQTSLGGKDGSYGGGFWMGAAGPAYGPDRSGQKNWIFATTANGFWDGVSNWGDSFLKLDPSLPSSPGSGYFTPVDQFYRNDPSCNSNPKAHGNDMDFGSGGVMLIPDSELLNWPQLAVNGEKEGGLWFTDRNSPGEHDNTCDIQSKPCVCAQLSKDNNVQVYWAGTGGKNAGPPFHTSSAFWENDGINSANYIYVTQQNVGSTGPLIQYALCNNAQASGPIDFTTCPGSPVKAVDGGGSVIDFGWGATPSVSANGASATDGIVWAISKPDKDISAGTTPGILYAVDAVSMTQLYSSATCGLDKIAPATKFSVPTVANGNVYVGTQQVANCPGLPCTNTGKGNFYIFGLGRTGC